MIIRCSIVSNGCSWFKGFKEMFHPLLVLNRDTGPEMVHEDFITFHAKIPAVCLINEDVAFPSNKTVRSFRSGLRPRSCTFSSLFEKDEFSIFLRCSMGRVVTTIPFTAGISSRFVAIASTQMYEPSAFRPGIPSGTGIFPVIDLLQIGFYPFNVIRVNMIAGILPDIFTGRIPHDLLN